MLLTEISIKDKFQKETQSNKNKLPFDVFEKLCYLDPTTQGEKVGKYTNWILAKYQPNSNLDLLHDALVLYHDKVKRGIAQRYNINPNINAFKSYNEFIDTIKSFDESNDTSISNSEYNNRKKLQGQFEIIGSTSEFDIIKPLTWEAERYFGGTTSWCTVANKNDFDRYISKDSLYIIYPKDGNPDKKMQFYFQRNEFADNKNNMYINPISCIANLYVFDSMSTQTFMELGKKCLELWGPKYCTGIVNVSPASDVPRYNLINEQMKFVFDKWYDKIEPTSLKNIYIVEKSNLFSVMNLNGENISKNWFKDIQFDEFSNWFELTLDDEGIMYMYPNGSYELDYPLYPELNGEVCYKRTDNGLLIVNQEGEPIINDIIKSYEYFPYGLTKLITINNTCLFVNAEGELISELNGYDNVETLEQRKYDDGTTFRPEFFVMYKNNSVNVYNLKKHSFIFSKWMENARILTSVRIYDNLYMISKNSKFNVFDTNGNFYLNDWYDTYLKIFDGRIVFASPKTKQKAILYPNKEVQYTTMESKQQIKLTLTDIKQMVMETIEKLYQK